MYHVFLFFLLVACSQMQSASVTKVHAKIKQPEASKSYYDKVREKYSRYKMVELDVIRKTKIKALDKTRETELFVFISEKGQLRLETKQEPKSLTILNAERALVIDEPDPFFGGPVRVLIAKNPELKNSQAFLRVIFGHGDLNKFYKIKNKAKDSIQLEAVNDRLAVKEVKVTFDLSNTNISQIDYTDVQGNEVSLVIRSTQFKKQSEPKLFNFEIPKDAEITEV
tara:strand:- start:15287 stop:15961 length:675 start_codon:yes stop_codon:yes gene_type:complete